MPGPIRRRTVLGAAAGGLAVAAGARVRAEQATTIRIGILTDLNGPNANGTGEGSVNATKMAAEDFMRAHPGWTVDVTVADYQSKADIAQGIAREWFDRQGVDVITNVNNSAAALAIASLVREKDKAAVFTAPASSDLTGKACGPNHVQWTYDTWSLGNCTGTALVAEGGTTWFFIAADYTFGKLLASDTARAVIAAGGKVLGTIKHPCPRDHGFFNVPGRGTGQRGQGDRARQ
jgi:branched-chain amino acid transport system substrate-binding protein